jgi:hypothetical protein
MVKDKEGYRRVGGFTIVTIPKSKVKQLVEDLEKPQIFERLQMSIGRITRHESPRPPTSMKAFFEYGHRYCRFRNIVLPGYKRNKLTGKVELEK